MKILYEKICNETKKYFDKYGFKRAVLGLSGGLDSTICAVILAEILGPKNVVGIFMPTKITTSQSEIDADKLAKNLKINYYKISIEPILNELRETSYSLFDKIPFSRNKNSFTMDNFQARIRANIIWGVANEMESTIPIATSDKSECYMGYATINGDMSGGFCPIADVLKTELFEIAKYKKDVVPKNIILKRPSAELAIDEKTNAPLLAEDALMPYPFMDEVIKRLEDMGQSFKDMMDDTFVWEKENNISKEQKKLWLEKFAWRTKGALYKWNLLPEVAKINPNSMNNKENYEKLISRFVF